MIKFSFQTDHLMRFLCSIFHRSRLLLPFLFMVIKSVPLPFLMQFYMVVLARSVKDRAKKAHKMIGLKAKLYHKKRHHEKVQMKKTLKLHEERNAKTKDDDEKVDKGALPAYLLDR